MTEPTDAQLRILDVLAMGRGRHAPMAYVTRAGTVTVYRAGREETAFDHADVYACVEAGWVCREPCRRYRITQAGRVKRSEER